MKKYSLEIQWAIIFMLMMLVWMVLERWAGLHDKYIYLHPYLTNLVAIPAISIFVLAIIDKKQSYYKGLMTYSQGFFTGLVITVIITVLSPITTYITLKLITPHFFINAINYAVFKGSMSFEQAEAYFNMKSYIFQSAIGSFIMGILTSAIIALFTKSKLEKK